VFLLGAKFIVFMVETKSAMNCGACPVCNVKATKHCARCASVYYCSKEHQTEHWSYHKAECKKLRHPNEVKSFANIGLTPAQKNSRIPKAIGSTFTVDAILFPTDEDIPRVVQLRFEVKSDEDMFGVPWHACDRSQIKEFLGDGLVDRRHIGRMEAGGAPIPGGCTLELVFRDDFISDGSRLNRSVQNLTGGDMGHNWRGNLLAYRNPAPTGGRIASDLVVNIEDGDLGILRNYFMGYRRAKTHHPSLDNILSLCL